MLPTTSRFAAGRKILTILSILFGLNAGFFLVYHFGGSFYSICGGNGAIYVRCHQRGLLTDYCCLSYITISLRIITPKIFDSCWNNARYDIFFFQLLYCRIYGFVSVLQQEASKLKKIELQAKEVELLK
jgi:hypothetical protein